MPKKLLCQDKHLLHIDLFCKICPLKRPRLGRGGAYQPKDNQLELLYSLKDYKDEAIDCPVYINIKVAYNGKEGTFATNHKLGDIDNLQKAILDGLVHWNIISDDRNVVMIRATKEYGKDDYCTIDILGVKYVSA